MQADRRMQFPFRGTSLLLLILPMLFPGSGIRIRNGRKKEMIEYRSFTGGIFETNCYALEAPEGWILFDAPDTACDWLVQQGIELRLLLLTHGHIDHIQDAAKIKRRFGCPVGVHPDGAPMLSDRE